MFVYKISLGYADLDEAKSFKDVSCWVFLLAENINSNFDSYVTEISQSEKPLLDYAPEGDGAANLIGKYLLSVEAMGRSLDLYVGTIRCAMESDTDGLACLIESNGIDVDLYDYIPEEIEPHQDGRMFCMIELFNVDKKFSEDSFNLNLISHFSSIEARMCISA